MQTMFTPIGILLVNYPGGLFYWTTSIVAIPNSNLPFQPAKKPTSIILKSGHETQTGAVQGTAENVKLFTDKLKSAVDDLWHAN